MPPAGLDVTEDRVAGSLGRDAAVGTAHVRTGEDGVPRPWLSTTAVYMAGEVAQQRRLVTSSDGQPWAHAVSPRLRMPSRVKRGFHARAAVACGSRARAASAAANDAGGTCGFLRVRRACSGATR